jgi:hypothetical protein
MAIKNRADLTTLLTNNITDALNRQNTASGVREVIQDVIDSCLNSIDDAASPQVVYNTTVTISYADVLTSYTTPIKLIESAGVGKAIVPLRAIVTVDYGTTPYATNTSPAIYSAGSTKNFFLAANSLAASIYKTFIMGLDSAYGATDEQIIEDKDIYFKTLSGNPTAGDSDLIINIQYIIIDL